MRTLDEKLGECKSLVRHEGVEACARILRERKRRVRKFRQGEGIIKSSTVVLRAPAGDNIRVPGLGVPDETEIAQLLEQRQMPPLADGQLERVVPWFASDERVDGEGDIVRQNWVFDDFEDNSPMPFSHQWEEPPVGRVIDWKIVERSDADYQGPALWLLTMFAGEGAWPFADSVFRLVKDGLLKGGSVGFFPSVVIDVTDDEERNELGLGSFGLIFDKNNLLEFSPATIPANPGAIALRALKRDVNLRPHDLHVVRELRRQQIVGDSTIKNHEAQWARSEEVLLAAMRALWPEEVYEFHKDLETSVTASVNLPENTDEEDMEKEIKILAEAVEDLTKAFGEFRTEIAEEIKTVVSEEIKIAVAEINKGGGEDDEKTKPTHTDDDEDENEDEDEDEEDKKTLTVLGDIFAKIDSVKEKLTTS